jgi:hypothetical protein
VASVAAVLLMGLTNKHGGRWQSHPLAGPYARMRILLQFIAIVIAMATIWVMGTQQ